MPGDPGQVLLDTHALLWWRADGSRLSPVATALLGSARLLVSPPTSCATPGRRSPR